MTVQPSPPRATRRGEEPFRERHRALLLRLNWPSDGRCVMLRTLGVTSARRREGVSTLAAELAAEAAAFDSRRVLLVDANLRFPSVHRRFGFEPTPGLVDCLFSDATEPNCWRTCPQTGLCVLPVGDAAGREEEAYRSPALPELIALLKDQFDLVVVDLPSGADAAAAVPITRRLDGVVLVVEAERARAATTRRFVDLLREAGVRTLGAVFNQCE